MVKRFASFFVVILFASTACASDFSPTLFSFAAPDFIQYNFDGSTLEVPITLIGKPATTIFLVYTKDQAENIGPIRNGFLGWHYVNKIDTCMYVSVPKVFDKGTNTIKWDGKNNDGNAVTAGEYTYYLWGFDSVNSKEKVYFGGYNARAIVTHDAKGIPYNKPIWYSNRSSDGANSKWIIGNDPLNESLLETTTFPPSVIGGGYSGLWYMVFDPKDKTKFWSENINWEAKVCRMLKFQWIPNGECTVETDWGDEGYVQYPPVSDTAVGHGGPANSNDEYVAIARDSYHAAGISDVDIVFIDMEEGAISKYFDLSDWWSSPDDYAAGGQMNGGPHIMDSRDHYLFLTSSISCHRHMVDPTREDEEDWFVYANDNGDYVSDHNFEEDASKPWVCNDWNVAPYMYSTGIDKHYFTIFNGFDLGAISFGIIGPDGTGIGYLSYSGETANLKQAQYIIDYESAYDGIYTDYMSIDDTRTNFGLWFVGQDSFKGVITNKVAVDEAAPVAFTVAQNSPNPFNPSTTISFSIAEASHVTVDIYNVAGQKVNTIANEFMSAGSHTRTWDASGFSAGVYFYTVKSGDYSKTMKMTLLK